MTEKTDTSAGKSPAIVFAAQGSLSYECDFLMFAICETGDRIYLRTFILASDQNWGAAVSAAAMPPTGRAL